MASSIRLQTMVAVLAVTASISVHARQERAKEPQAMRDIRSVLDKQVEAWNRKDLTGFMRGYWNSPGLTFYSGGTTISGWQATLDRYRKRYQSEGREMGKLDFSELQIEMLGPKSAFVRGKWHLKMTTGDVGGLFTLILRQFPAGWKIIHDHTQSSP